MAEALASGQTAAGTETLISLLAPAEHPAVRTAAAYSLGFARTAAAREALLARLADPAENKSVRLQAAASLANYDAFPQTYPALTAAASDADQELRAQALVSLANAFGYSRQAEVRAALNAALSDASPLVRQAAADRLAALEVQK
jgi:HEAT repeat protein